MVENKLSGETIPRDMNRKAKLISSCLVGYPEGLSPKIIASKTGLNYNTVKGLLPKMSNIVKVTRGFYKVLNKGDSPRSFPVELSDWNFHNLIMTAPTNSPPFSRVLDFGLVKLDFSVSPIGKATARVSTDYPMNVSSICFVAGMFAREIKVDQSKIMISTVEFNRDFRALRLDGCNSISVDNLVEQFKVYQKRRGLRIEHKTKVPISATTVLDMLSNNPNSLEFNMKLNKQQEELKLLSKNASNMSQLLMKLIDRMNEVRT